MSYKHTYVHSISYTPSCLGHAPTFGKRSPPVFVSFPTLARHRFPSYGRASACNVFWQCALTGLGILNLNKFAMALRLRWLCLAWVDEDKPWVGLGNPCNKDDRDFCAVATTVTISNGKKALFWASPWMDGNFPKDPAPLIYAISTIKKVSVAKALTNDSWISEINMDHDLTTDHTIQFATL